MITIGEIYDYIDGFAPFSTALGFDNAGLLVGSRNDTVEKILVALDVTPAVIEEARQQGAQLIVSHHPVIFQPLRRLSRDSIPYRLAQAGIGAVCAHTNLDMAQGGVNDCLGETLGLKNLSCFVAENTIPYWKIAVFVPVAYAQMVTDAMTQAGAGRLGQYQGCSFTVQGKGAFLPMEGAHPAIGQCGVPEQVDECRVEVLCSPDDLSAVLDAMRKAHPYEEPAFDVVKNYGAVKQLPGAVVGEWETPMQPKEFVAHVKERLQCEGVRYVEGTRPIRRVAFCGGAGGDRIFEAIAGNVDAYVTGEMKHHEWLAASQSELTVVDAGHFKTENVIVGRLVKQISGRFPQVSVAASDVCTDGVHYL